MNDIIENEVVIKNESDIVLVRRVVRVVSGTFGFGLTDTTRIVTAASELTRNIFKYAHDGIVNIKKIYKDSLIGIELTFTDHGPGIPDIQKAMEEGYSTSGGFGMGLPGAKRLMDEMDIHSSVGKGTTIILKKWLPGN